MHNRRRKPERGSEARPRLGRREASAREEGGARKEAQVLDVKEDGEVWSRLQMAPALSWRGEVAQGSEEEHWGEVELGATEGR